MAPQLYSWTCSICSTTWVMQALGIIDPNFDQYAARDEVGAIIGYPNCVNETYGCMSADCLIAAFKYFGLEARQAWVTFDQAYAIANNTTGIINPIGMYHFMAIRGTRNGDIWVANSAPGYDGVWDNLTRSAFNNLGPVQVIYLVP